MRHSFFDRKTCIMLFIFLILLISLVTVFYTKCQQKKAYIKTLEERNSVVRMNNHIIEGTNDLYQECQQIKEICKQTHPQVIGMAVID